MHLIIDIWLCLLLSKLLLLLLLRELLLRSDLMRLLPTTFLQTINKFKTLSVPLSQQMVRESLASVPNEQHQAPARVIGHPVNSQLMTSCSALPERSSSFNSSVNLSIDMGGLCEHLRRGRNSSSTRDIDGTSRETRQSSRWTRNLIIICILERNGMQYNLMISFLPYYIVA